MTWVDYFIVGTIALSAFVSLLRGFVREAMSLAVWILGFWVAWSFFRDVAPLLAHWIAAPSIQLGTAFALLLVATLILGGLINYLIGQLVDRTGLSGTDRLFGMAFGIARGALVIALLVMLAGLTPLPNDPWWKESLLLGHFERLAHWIGGLMPPELAKRLGEVVH
ncbi:MAG: CvpA family protein [Gammaproteobacteria bacterium]|jgi:membrane protein required for colicin V production|nr:CvpA family protein [Gammaproteobacteria bacterium]